MEAFVGVALRVCEDMEMADKASQGIVMRFCKIYSPEKIGAIVKVAKSFYWWHTNPKAAFMKAVGLVNKALKEKK